MKNNNILLSFLILRLFMSKVDGQPLSNFLSLPETQDSMTRRTPQETQILRGMRRQPDNSLLFPLPENGTEYDTIHDMAIRHLKSDKITTKRVMRDGRTYVLASTSETHVENQNVPQVSSI